MVDAAGTATLFRMVFTAALVLTVAISTARARVIDFHDAGGVPNEFSLATAWKNGGLMHVHDQIAYFTVHRGRA